MTINTTEELNKLYEKLKNTVENIEVTKYFPNKKLSVPLNGKFCASIGVKSNQINAQNNQQIAVFEVELLSPVNSTGEAIFKKATEVTSALLGADVLPIESCVIGDIEYITSQRAYRTYITLTVQNLFDENAGVNIGEDEYSCIVVSEKELYTACDIKVYGQTKPIDMILSDCEYVINIKCSKELELLQNGFDVKTGRFKYLKCFVKSVVAGNDFFEYEIISRERLAI